MKIFVSYAFNDANKWIEDLVVPLIKALGYEVVTGQRLEGEVLIDGVDARLRGCTGCVAFSTRRDQRANGSYETHPWVMSELTKARALGFKTIEVREDGVTIGNDADAYVRLKYREAERDRMLIRLAENLAAWKTRRVRLRLDPPEAELQDFMRCAARSVLTCTYELQQEDEEIGRGEAKIVRQTGACFVEIEVPATDVLVRISLKKEADNNIAWASFPEGLMAIPIKLH